MSIFIKVKEVKSTLLDFWKKNERKTVILIGMLLVAVISFEMGVLKGQDWQKPAVVVEKVPENQVVKLSDSGSCVAAASSNSAVLGAKNEAGSDSEKKESCAFVGSKNSNKYHKSTCALAKKIKESNKVCFKSIEDAESKGYIGAGCCMK